MTFLVIGGILIYLVGFIGFINIVTLDDVTYFKRGGIFGGPTTHCSNRKVTQKDMLKAYIWPVYFIAEFCKTLLQGINEIIYFLVLSIGGDYSKTRFYKWTDNF